jgi:hypothetical protein
MVMAANRGLMLKKCTATALGAQDAGEFAGTNVLAGFASNWSRGLKQKLSRNTF